jgi:hypothetical protein
MNMLAGAVGLQYIRRTESTGDTTTITMELVDEDRPDRFEVNQW